MKQTEFNFIQEACVDKINAILKEVLSNDEFVKKAKEKTKPKTTKKESK